MPRRQRPRRKSDGRLCPCGERVICWVVWVSISVRRLSKTIATARRCSRTLPHTPNEAVTTAQHHLKCTVPPHCPHPPSGSHLIPQPRQQLPSPLRAAVDPMSISEQPLSLDGGVRNYAAIPFRVRRVLLGVMRGVIKVSYATSASFSPFSSSWHHEK